MNSPDFFDLSSLAPAADAHSAIIAGLLAGQAQISPAYFYDALGSALFAAICELDEYYPTRTESVIMVQHRGAIVQALGKPGVLIDLGAGNCRKAAQLLAHYRATQYVAVDVSVDFLKLALADVQLRYPALQILGVGQNFTEGLTLPGQIAAGPRVMFYPGSSLGNFTPDQALGFLRSVREQSIAGVEAAGRLLIGIDLVKPRDILELAYDDPLGVTAAFNLNMLKHLNQVLGSDFDIAQWSHRAWFNEAQSRIEMHLVARQPLRVSWPGGSRDFASGETIHTESSYKYSIATFERLLAQAGYHSIQHWTDEKAWFGVFVAQA
jgi:L-histidine Nalpha-methyltransferase